MSVAAPVGTDRFPLAGVYLREAGYEFLSVLRMPAFAIPSLAFPAVFYVLFALVLPGQWGPVDKGVYLLATYSVFGVIGPALFGFGVGVAMERQAGWLALKRASPMPIGAWFFAKIAMSLLFGLLVVLILSALALIGGVRMPVPTWLTLLGVLVAGTLPFCALGLLIGSAARAQAAVAIVNLVYLPMSLLSGLWVPLMVFPEWLQRFAVVLPPYHLADMALAVVGIGESRPWLAFAVLGGCTVVFLLLARVVQRRRDNDAH